MSCWEIIIKRGTWGGVEWRNCRTSIDRKKVTKRCLKGLFPNINFEEKFRYKNRPSFIPSHNIHCFMLLHCLFRSKSYHQLLWVGFTILRRSGKKVSFWYIWNHFPSLRITPWIHIRRRRRAKKRGKVFLSWLTSYFSRNVSFFFHLLASDWLVYRQTGEKRNYGFVANEGRGGGAIGGEHEEQANYYVMKTFFTSSTLSLPFFLGLELRIHITSIVNLLAIKVTNISSSPDKNRRRHSSSHRRCNLFTIATKRTARKMERTLR